MDLWFDKLLTGIMLAGVIFWCLLLLLSAIDNNKHRYDK
jgi:hypothetical protein